MKSMGDNWSRVEVEATVADYFDMLYKQESGLDYNKTEHRHRLAQLLNRRSDGAIEYKHQNISAVLRDMGFPWILGYKPMGNYQQLLYDVVLNRFQANQALEDIVSVQVDQPAVMPVLDDILGALVDPPPASPERPAFNTRERIARSMRYQVNYLEKESQNRSLGAAGEEFIIEFERARLTNSGHKLLASKIKHTSVIEGDSAGYDILSFETSGQERLIEVKTTRYGVHTPFYVTRNEVEVSRQATNNYYLYRAFDFRRRPKLFTKQGPLTESFNLDPVQYLASVS